jgi:uncharacterized protein
MAAEPTIDYEALAQDAMRNVVRTVLKEAAKSGLPGDHHFYISFDTAASGVVLSKRLKEKYPHEMTVVLQHRFWDLAVTDDGFEVKLTFDGIPERLVVPFAAIRVFFDPSVRYGFQFEDADAEPEDGDGSLAQRFGGRTPERTNSNGAKTQLRSTAPKKPRVPRKSKAKKTATTKTTEAPQPDAGASPEPETLKPAARKATGDEAPAHDNGQDTREGTGGAQIVSLDAFRKK